MRLAFLAAIAAAVTLAPYPAEAQVHRQLQFFNNCPVPVRYFIAIPRNGTWQTFGWFNATGNKPAYNLLDQYRNPIVIPEGTRVHYYAETTGQPSIRWAGNVQINMNGANFSAKPAALSVRGGKFQFGLNCDKEMNRGYAAPSRAPTPNYGGAGRSAPGWAVGKRVMCNFKRAGAYYPGRIAQIRTGDAIYIEYDDGDREWTTTTACRPG